MKKTTFQPTGTTTTCWKERVSIPLQSFDLRPLTASPGRPSAFPRRNLVLEDHAEELPAEPVGQPGVLQDGHLQALAAQHGVVVGVDRSAHSLDDHQVSLALPHHHGQHLIQAAEGGGHTHTQFSRRNTPV